MELPLGALTSPPPLDSNFRLSKLSICFLTPGPSEFASDVLAHLLEASKGCLGSLRLYWQGWTGHDPTLGNTFADLLTDLLPVAPSLRHLSLQVLHPNQLSRTTTFFASTSQLRHLDLYISGPSKCLKILDALPPSLAFLTLSIDIPGLGGFDSKSLDFILSAVKRMPGLRKLVLRWPQPDDVDFILQFWDDAAGESAQDELAEECAKKGIALEWDWSLDW